MSTYEDRVTRYTDGLGHISASACPGCTRCGLEDLCEDHPDYSNRMDIANEGSFSWISCDTCGSTLGGQRYHAHAIIEDEITHLDICTDCLFFFSNGDIPAEGEK